MAAYGYEEPLVIETNCLVHIDVGKNTQEGVGSEYWDSGGGYVNITLNLAAETPYLLVSPVEIPQHLGGGQVQCDSPVDLPLKIELFCMRFSEMLNYNSRRAEIYIGYTTSIGKGYHESMFSVMLRFTVSEYQDVFECVKLDLIYFKILHFLNTHNPMSVDLNKGYYHTSLPGDRLQFDLAKLRQDEGKRRRRTLDDFNHILSSRGDSELAPNAFHSESSPVPSVHAEPRNSKSDEEKTRSLALAVLRALAAASPFVKHLRSNVKEENKIGFALLQALDKPTDERDEKLMEQLLKHESPLEMIHGICEVIDSKRSGGSVRCDAPFALRLSRRLITLSDGTTPNELKHDQPTPERCTGIGIYPGTDQEKVSLLDNLRHSLWRQLSFDLCEKVLDGITHKLRPLAKLTGKPPDVLYIEVERSKNNWKDENILDEPEWLVLDSLYDLDGVQQHPARNLPMSYHDTASLIETSKSEVAKGFSKRLATYKKVTVVRLVQDHIGTEIYQDDRILRIPDNNEDKAESILFKQPTTIEMMCSILLVYVRVTNDVDVEMVDKDGKVQYEKDDYIPDESTNAPRKPGETPRARAPVISSRRNRPVHSGPPPGGLAAVFGKGPRKPSPPN